VDFFHENQAETQFSANVLEAPHVKFQQNCEKFMAAVASKL
jgi:hypothetical protein